MSTRGHLRLAATLAQTTQALETLIARLKPEIPADDLDSIELGVAEVLTNLVKHGFDPGRPSRIHVRWFADRVRAELQIADTGRPVPREMLDSARRNPLDYSDTDVLDLPESGLGLALIMRMFDVVDYRSRRGVNRLRLRRKFRR